MKNLKSISVFFPCLNDGKSLPYLLDKTYKVLPKITQNYEVIVIDDGSTDDSIEVVQSLIKYYRHLRLIKHKKNLGYGGVLKTGFNSSKKEWVFYTDGDGQYDPAEIVNLVLKVREDIDVVNGYKIKRQDSYIRRLLGSIYNGIVQKLYDLPIKDVDCDFRLIRKSTLAKVKLVNTSGIICLELILKLKKMGARFAQTPIHHYKRPFGRSQFFRVKHVYKMIKDNVRFFLEQS